MNVMDYGYKVLSVNQGQLISWSVFSAALTYKQGVWTVRVVGDGPLALFKDIRSAEAFRKGYGCTDIASPIYRAAFIKTGSPARGLWSASKRLDGGGYSCRGPGNWSRPKSYTFSPSYHALPDGTVLADAICLLEEVV